MTPENCVQKLKRAATTAERQRQFRQRKAQAGETEVRGIFAHPDLHQQIKAQAAKTKRKEKTA